MVGNRLAPGAEIFAGVADPSARETVPAMLLSSTSIEWNELIAGEQLNLDGPAIDTSAGRGVIMDACWCALFRPGLLIRLVKLARSILISDGPRGTCDTRGCVQPVRE